MGIGKQLRMKAFSSPRKRLADLYSLGVKNLTLRTFASPKRLHNVVGLAKSAMNLEPREVLLTAICGHVRLQRAGIDRSSYAAHRITCQSYHR